MLFCISRSLGRPFAQRGELCEVAGDCIRMWVLRCLLSTVLGARHAQGLCAFFSALGHGQTSSIDASRTDERTRSWCAQATLP